MVNLFGSRWLASAAGLPSASTKEQLFAFTADPPSFDFRRDPPSPKAMACQASDGCAGHRTGELGSEEETDYATTE
jgi:hypothetical protein